MRNILIKVYVYNFDFLGVKTSPESKSQQKRSQPCKKFHIVWITVVTKKSFEECANASTIVHDMRVFTLPFDVVTIEKRLIVFSKFFFRL